MFVTKFLPVDFGVTLYNSVLDWNENGLKILTGKKKTWNAPLSKNKVVLKPRNNLIAHSNLCASAAAMLHHFMMNVHL